MNYKVSEPIKYERKFVSAYRTNVEWGLHIHRHIEIVLVTDGVLRMQINDDVVDIPKGYAAFAESFEPHSFISDNDNDAVIIEFSPEIFSPFSRWLGEYKIGCRAVKIDECISELVTRLLPDDHTKQTYFGEIGEARMLAVLAPLCNAFIDGGEWQRREEKYDDLFIRALVYVSENFDKHLTRDSVAKELGVCPETVSRVFARRTSISFVEYVQRIRIYEAAKLLEAGNTVTSAALSSGFDSVRTFNRVFRNTMGKTPTEFLRKY